MKSSGPRVLALFSIIGVASGLLSAIISSVSSTWAWIGIGVFLGLALIVSAAIASRLKWIFLNLRLERLILAALIIVASYPLAVLVMIAGHVVYEAFYARAFPTEWQERVYSGSFPYSILPLFLAAVVSAVFVSSALRLLTDRWEKPVMLLLVIAGILTIPLSQTLAGVIGESNWHLVLFPIGEALFGLLSGYWLVKASSDPRAIGLVGRNAPTSSPSGIVRD